MNSQTLGSRKILDCSRTTTLRNQAAEGRGKTEARRRAYGKGRIHSSKGFLSNFFYEEHEVEKHLSRIALNPEPASIPCSQAPLGDTNQAPQSGSDILSTSVENLNPPLSRTAKDHLDCSTSSSTGPFPTANGTCSKKSVTQNSGQSLALLLAECHKSKEVCRFSTWTDKVKESFEIEKVSEGSYGEVYKLRKSRPGEAEDMYHDSIFKLVPLKRLSENHQDKQQNKHDGMNENLTDLESLVREVRILKRMDAIPGFVRFRDVTVLQGASPSAFNHAWQRYFEANRNKDLKPDHPSMYKEDQVWAMLEMGDCGRELDSLGTISAQQAFDIFWSICVSLSLGEDLAEFEHRDLHLSNICIQPSCQPRAIDKHGRDNGIKFGRSRLQTSIIDFGLSRVRCLDMADGNSDIVLYDPNHVPDVLHQRGRSDTECLQYEAYRQMRNHVDAVERDARRKDRSLETKRMNKWSRFLPKNNVIWLEYLSKALLIMTTAHDGSEVQHDNEATRHPNSQQRADILPPFQAIAPLLSGGDSHQFSAGKTRAELSSKTSEARSRQAPSSASEVLELAMISGLVDAEDLDAIKQSLQGG